MVLIFPATVFSENGMGRNASRTMRWLVLSLEKRKTQSSYLPEMCAFYPKAHRPSEASPPAELKTDHLKDGYIPAQITESAPSILSLLRCQPILEAKERRFDDEESPHIRWVSNLSPIRASERKIVRKGRVAQNGLRIVWIRGERWEDCRRGNFWNGRRA